MNTRKPKKVLLQLLKESGVKEEIKKRFLKQILSNFVSNPASQIEDDSILGQFVKTLDKKKNLTSFDFYYVFWKFLYEERYRDNRDFYENVLLPIYNSFYLGRTSLIDSFFLLRVFLYFEDGKAIDLTYNSLLNIIKNVASLFHTFSKFRQKEECEMLYDVFFVVLVNLKKGLHPMQKKSFTEKEMQEALQPCEAELAKICSSFEKYNSYFHALMGKESVQLDKGIFNRVKKGKPLSPYHFLYIESGKNGRFKEIEKFLTGSIQQLREYIENGLRQRAPELEPYIVQDPNLCLAYLQHSAIGERIPEIENVIAKDPWCSYYYAVFIIRDRFQKGEDAIAQDAHYSYIYAVQILRGRFIKGEPVIKKDPVYRKEYKSFLENLENK